RTVHQVSHLRVLDHVHQHHLANRNWERFSFPGSRLNFQKRPISEVASRLARTRSICSCYAHGAKRISSHPSCSLQRFISSASGFFFRLPSSDIRMWTVQEIDTI